MAVSDDAARATSATAMSRRETTHHPVERTTTGAAVAVEEVEGTHQPLVAPDQQHAGRALLNTTGGTRIVAAKKFAPITVDHSPHAHFGRDGSVTRIAVVDIKLAVAARQNPQKAGRSAG
ncbi:ORFL237C [Human betaherpesvirus 5]|nr:ORFL237C [Human betaherpesvirus 5]QHX40606.1 ORFL237C [Human betaherpesvirus 5]